MQKSNIVWASFFALTGVVLGAFAAHTLESRLSADQISSFQTGVRYQFYHAVALLFLGLWSQNYAHKYLRVSSLLFIVGIFLFSGSIYLLNCRELLNVTHWKWLGPITPLGGTCFILGWGILMAAAIKFKPVADE